MVGAFLICRVGNSFLHPLRSTSWLAANMAISSRRSPISSFVRSEDDLPKFTNPFPSHVREPCGLRLLQSVKEDHRFQSSGDSLSPCHSTWVAISVRQAHFCVLRKRPPWRLRLYPAACGSLSAHLWSRGAVCRGWRGREARAMTRTECRRQDRGIAAFTQPAAYAFFNWLERQALELPLSVLRPRRDVVHDASNHGLARRVWVTVLSRLSFLNSVPLLSLCS